MKPVQSCFKPVFDSTLKIGRRSLEAFEPETLKFAKVCEKLRNFPNQEIMKREE